MKKGGYWRLLEAGLILRWKAHNYKIKFTTIPKEHDFSFKKWS